MKPTRLIAAALATVAAGTASALTLTVEVTDARSAQGSVNAALYAEAGAWLTLERAVHTQKAPSGGAKTVLVFTGLAPGRYALSTYHDENGNGRLDANVLGMPTERYGFTGGPASMGAPSFDQAAVDLRADTVVSVTLH